jgi:hypothetical protein
MDKGKHDYTADDFAGNKEDRKSISDHIILMGNSHFVNILRSKIQLLSLLLKFNIQAHLIAQRKYCGLKIY